jgi:hypothetical protein
MECLRILVASTPKSCTQSSHSASPYGDQVCCVTRFPKFCCGRLVSTERCLAECTEWPMCGGQWTTVTCRASRVWTYRMCLKLLLAGADNTVTSCYKGPGGGVVVPARQSLCAGGRAQHTWSVHACAMRLHPRVHIWVIFIVRTFLTVKPSQTTDLLSLSNPSY